MYVVDYKLLTPRRPARRRKGLIFSVLGNSSILMQKNAGRSTRHAPHPHHYH